MGSALCAQIAAAAAKLVVEDGMEYAAAKRKAARLLERRGVREFELPSNEQVEDEVRAYLALFCADTQPAELRALRELALLWMERKFSASQYWSRSGSEPMMPKSSAMKRG